MFRAWAWFRAIIGRIKVARGAKPLADRVKATEQALREAATAVTPADLAKRFLRAKPEDLAEILDTLVAMSRAHKEGEKFSV